MSYRLGCLLPGALLVTAGLVACRPGAAPIRTTTPAIAAPFVPPVTPKPVAPEPYYANCDAARAAGATPLRRGQPGYRSALDRDNDGRACES
jgi:hypothetical protein